MGIRDQQAYKELAKQLDESRKLEANLLIVTLPCTGISRALKEYVQDINDIQVSLWMDNSGNITSYNLINLDWNDDNAISEIDQILKKATPSQHFAVVINYPGRMEESKVKNSYLLTHIYKRYYFGCYNIQDTRDLMVGLKPNITEDEVNKIYKRSGGIVQIVKALALEANDQEILNIVTPIISAIKNTDLQTLEALGVAKKGVIGSELLREKLDNLDSKQMYDIKVNFDLSFEEGGKKSANKVTAVEKKIIEKIVLNNGEINKEEISDIKWGDGKYDKYSDQAIKKQILRLGEKLTRYRFVAVTGVGYKLVPIENAS